MSPRTRKVLHVATMPIVAGAIYAWLIKQAILEARVALAHRWWPGPPTDHP
jgi:hypothetical protein